LKSNAISQFRRAIEGDRPYKIVLFPSKPYIHHTDNPQFNLLTYPRTVEANSTDAGRRVLLLVRMLLRPRCECKGLHAPAGAASRLFSPVYGITPVQCAGKTFSHIVFKHFTDAPSLTLGSYGLFKLLMVRTSVITAVMKLPILRVASAESMNILKLFE